VIKVALCVCMNAYRSCVLVYVPVTNEWPSDAYLVVADVTNGIHPCRCAVLALGRMRPYQTAAARVWGYQRRG
jgi:hypothetical protein